jgi:hypothetical protein
MLPPLIDVDDEDDTCMVYTTTTGTSTNYHPIMTNNTGHYYGSDVTFAPSKENITNITLEVVVEALRKTDEELALLFTSPKEEERKYAELIAKLRQELKGGRL